MAIDTYHESCLCYKDKKHRAWHEAMMLLSGIGIFERQLRIVRYFDYTSLIASLAVSGLPTESSQRKLLKEFTSEAVIDSFRIVMCFELYMKSILLKKGYLVHKIKKSTNVKLEALREKQRDNPVSIKDFMLLDKIQYDSVAKHNIFPAIEKQNTLGVGKLLNTKLYKEAIGLSNEIHGLVKAHVKKRNSHHFLPDNSASYSNGAVNELKTLAKFVDDVMVKSYNAWCVSEKCENLLQRTISDRLS